MRTDLAPDGTSRRPVTPTKGSQQQCSALNSELTAKAGQDGLDRIRLLCHSSSAFHWILNSLNLCVSAPCRGTAVRFATGGYPCGRLSGWAGGWA